MTVIDIGSAPISRATNGDPFTFIDKSNPADGTGTLDTWQIYALNNMSNVEVATFYVVSGNNFSTRDSETIGAVAAGSVQTFTGLSTDVSVGDFAGEYHSLGAIYRDASGGGGLFYKTGDNIPCTNAAFSSWGAYPISLYATGATAVTFIPKIIFM